MPAIKRGFTGTIMVIITETGEETLWQAMRAMEEGTMLMKNIAEHFEESGQHEAAKIFGQKAEDNGKGRA